MKTAKYIVLVCLIVISWNVYSQVDSLQNRIIYSWRLNPVNQNTELEDIDTSLFLFHNYNPVLKQQNAYNYLGNMGSAAQSKNYIVFDKKQTSFIFSQPYTIYFHLPQNQTYYNTKQQFTLLKYSNAGPKNESEQVLKVLHAQNVNPKLNFGLNYDMISSDGRYLNQQVKQNLITVFSSYQGEQYTMHANFNLNRAKFQENGGIDSLQYLENDDFSNRKNVPVRLENAKGQLLNTSFYVANQFRFGKPEKVKTETKTKPVSTDAESNSLKGKPTSLKQKKGLPAVKSKPEGLNDTTKIAEKAFKDSINIQVKDTLDPIVDTLDIPKDIDPNETSKEKSYLKWSGLSLSHELIYNSDVRKYSDDNLAGDFYNTLNIFINSSSTNDEVRQTQLGNKVMLKYSAGSFSSGVSYYNEQMKYIYNILPDSSFINNDTIIKTTFDNSLSNSGLSFFINTRIVHNLYFSGSAEYYIQGYKDEDSKLDLNLYYLFKDQSRISLMFNYKQSQPDYFYQRYSSNHFQWQNNYLRNSEIWDAGLNYASKKYRLKAQISYSQLTNHLYFDSTAFIAQHHGQINILSVDVYKHFKWGIFNSVTNLVYQKSNADSIYNIPEFNLYQSVFLEHLWQFPSTGGSLLWQLGFDYRYTSSYYSNRYMPPLGMFYTQNDLVQPEYHCLDVFLNFAIKRARLYLKYNYINVLINKNYPFTSPYYPAPEPLFKFGFAWTFYD